MKIVIGETPRAGPAGQHRPDADAGMVEARLLEIKGPRRRYDGPPSEQEERREAGNPVSGRILTLFIPEGHKVPAALETGNCRIYLRFVPRNGVRHETGCRIV